MCLCVRHCFVVTVNTVSVCISLHVFVALCHVILLRHLLCVIVVLEYRTSLVVWCDANCVSNCCCFYVMSGVNCYICYVWTVECFVWHVCDVINTMTVWIVNCFMKCVSCVVIPCCMNCLFMCYFTCCLHVALNVHEHSLLCVCMIQLMWSVTI